MIIREFHAENILKYTELHLENLPARGLIGISGANESGKTAIVESICLALFGRTFSYTADAVHKTMKWGAPKASVDLVFSVGDKTRFRVTRYLNMEGQHSARLIRTDLSSSEETMVAQGERSVTRAVEDACGFNFEQYVESFYLAQREIELPNAGSGMVKGLLGIAELDRVADELGAEIDAARNRIDDLQQQIDDQRAQQERLALREEALASYETDLDAQRGQSEQAVVALADLRDGRERLNRVGEELDTELSGIRESTTELRFSHWQERVEQLDKGMESLDSSLLAVEQDAQTDSSLRGWVVDLTETVTAYAGIRQQVDAYAGEQRRWLGYADDHEAEDETGGDQARNETGNETGGEDRYQVETDSIARDSRGLRSGRRRVRFTALLLLVLSAALLTGWWLLTNEPGNPWSAQIQERVDQGLALAGWQDAPRPSQMTAWKWGGGGALCIGLLLILRSSALSRRIRFLRYKGQKLDSEAAEARAHLEQLEELDKHSLAEEVELLRNLGHPDISEAATEFAEGIGHHLIDSEALADWLAPLADAQDILSEDMENVKTRLSDTEHRFVEGVADQQQVVLHAEGMVEKEQQRRAENAAIDVRIADLQGQLPEPRERIKLRKLGLEQIKGSCRRIYNDFNVQMRDYLVRLIPLFTEGRYRHLKIDDEFKVQVFSNDKNDFVELQELSSGTHRQLVLGVRLALSQALVDAHTRGPQSMILDEPFAFFDRERIRLTLETLPEVSQEISQIWVISQEFDSAGFDLHLRCSRDQDTLVVAG